MGVGVRDHTNFLFLKGYLIIYIDIVQKISLQSIILDI